MKKPLALITLAAALGATQASAHETNLKPRHGGMIRELNEHQVELVLAKDGVRVCVNDHDGKPIAANKITGKVTVLAAGKKIDIELKADKDNCVAGAGEIGAKATVVVALVVNGVTVSGRFRSAK